MLVREALGAEAATAREADGAGRVRLPTSLKADKSCARTTIFRGLSANRLFALGDRRGVLGAAQRRSGRPFRLDVRQRVVVKALVSRHLGTPAVRRQAFSRHVSYLGRTGAGADGERAGFFDRVRGGIDAQTTTAAWAEDRHHFRFIVSPEHGDRLADLQGYVREVMERVAGDLGEAQLAWIATCHFDTDQPHAHVLIRGRREDGRDLVIPRDYVGYGFRGRAQEVAQERLGDLSRADAERRVWRETQADRFTSFDRRLLEARDANSLVEDGVGARASWAALTRGRLRHLEALGLAVRVGRLYRLDEALELKLRGLQLRQDIIRTMHARRLEGGREVRLMGAERVRGRVVARGFHDELGAVGWVVVQEASGAECYARLAFGASQPTVGKTIDLVNSPRGAQLVTRSSSLER
jgi:type IV secretory pathway VirD2 relaxase